MKNFHCGLSSLFKIRNPFLKKKLKTQTVMISNMFQKFWCCNISLSCGWYLDGKDRKYLKKWKGIKYTYHLFVLYFLFLFLSFFSVHRFTLKKMEGPPPLPKFFITGLVLNDFESFIFLQADIRSMNS